MSLRRWLMFARPLDGFIVAGGAVVAVWVVSGTTFEAAKIKITTQHHQTYPFANVHTWDWSPDGTLLVGWQPLGDQRSMVVYSFTDHHYDRFVTGVGSYPIWMNDNRRILFREGGKLYLLDRLSGKWRELLSLQPPSQIGRHELSHDNKRLYYTSGNNEADIWLLKTELPAQK